MKLIRISSTVLLKLHGVYTSALLLCLYWQIAVTLIGTSMIQVVSTTDKLYNK